MTIIVYSFEDAEGNEVGTFQTQSGREAENHARKYSYNVKANEYEFSDSYLVDEWQFAKEV